MCLYLSLYLFLFFLGGAGGLFALCISDPEDLLKLILCTFHSLKQVLRLDDYFEFQGN